MKDFEFPEIAASLTDGNEYCGRCGRKLALLDQFNGNWYSSCRQKACAKQCTCFADLKQSKETESCMVHWKCDCRNGHICTFHKGRPEMAVSRYSNRKDDWVFTDAFQQVFDEAKKWTALYEKQRKAALNHCGSCWAQLKARKNAKGGKPSYCPKGCKCTCNSNRSCVVHLECTCLTTWICEFHKTKRPDVAVALYNALPPNERARLILVNSFAHEGIDQTKFKRRGRRPKELKLADLASSGSQYKSKESSVNRKRPAFSTDAPLPLGSTKQLRSVDATAEVKTAIRQVKESRKADITLSIESKLPGYKNWLENQPLSEHSKRNYMSRVSAFIDYLRKHGIGWSEMASANKDEPVSKLCQHLKSQNLKPATINSYLAAIDNFFEFLDLGRLKTSRQKVLQRDRSVLSSSEQKRFLRATRNTRRAKDRAIAFLLYETGVKINECVNLELADLKTSGRKKALRVRHQDGSEREIILSAEVCEAIDDWLEERNEKFSDKNTAAMLFLNPQGNRLLPNAVYEIVRKIGRECGLELTPHTLRDTAVGNFLKSEDDVLAVAELAGHRSLNSTKKYLIGVKRR